MQTQILHLRPPFLSFCISFEGDRLYHARVRERHSGLAVDQFKLLHFAHQIGSLATL